MSVRRLYTVVDWDEKANVGHATDGSSWEGEKVLFNIEGMDSSVGGHLVQGETISAEETIRNDGSRHLFDIVVEPMRQQLPYCGEYLDGEAPAAQEAGSEYDRIKALEDRVADLEKDMQYVLNFVPDEILDGE